MMNEVSTWSDLFFNSLTTFGQKLMGALPGIIGALLILLLGWLFAKVISSAVRKLLSVMRFDKLADRVNVKDFLEKANIKLTPSGLISRFVYWLIILLVIITASDALGWSAVSEEISKLLGYLPQLLAAIVFFIVGVYIASFVRDVILGATRTLSISAGKIISTFVFYLLMMLVTLTALEQAGIDTSIITSNLLLIIGAIMAAAAISYGFASRDVLSNILGSFFSRRTFTKGQKIEIDGQVGEIVAMNNISVTIRISDNERLVIPAQQLITKQIRIIDN
ncbi:MAG: mechanosensitive ion channel domain-containing protein [Bacteroidota bacterium]